jgi:DNA-binding GntR family transcriptional regulator
MLDTQRNQLLSLVIPEELARLLQEEIVCARIAPSARLTEEEVARTYGVSRSPVREAFRLLERDGLIHKAPRRGIWVTPMSLKDFDDIYACRIPLEALAAQRAAGSPDQPAKDRLAPLVEALQRAEAERDVQSFFATDVEVTGLIYELCDNQTLRRLIGTLEKQALRYRYFGYAREPAIVSLSAEGSQRICEAIMRGDADVAHAETVSLLAAIFHRMRPLIAEAFRSAAA